MKKVSEWLNELGTHTILDCAEAKMDFTLETGFEAPWGDGYTPDDMCKQIEARGKGGSINKEFDARLIGSCDVAQACYDTYRGSEEAQSKYGMGSQFREYVDAISRNGK